MPTDQDVLSAILRTDLVAFTHKSFHTLNPGVAYESNWHIEAIVYELMQVYSGSNRRLIINVPPRSLKSTIVSVVFPAYLLGRNPGLRIIIVCYSDELTKKFSRDFRTLIKSDWYRRLFPAAAAAPIKDSESEFVTADNGGRFATSIGGTITGRGADMLIIDDPIKAADVASPVMRTQVNDWVLNSLLSRLDNPAKGSVIVTMQRLHQDDLSGFLLERGGYRHLKIPAIAAEGEAAFRLSAKTAYQRKAGEPIEPGRISHEELIKKQQEVGSFIFSAQYQQDPVPDGGNIFRPEYMNNRVDLNSSGIKFEQIVISWDVACKTGERNDYSVGTVWGVFENNYYLLDVRQGKWEYPDLVREIEELARMHRADNVLIEDAHIGTGLIQDLSQKTNYNIIGVKPEMDKQTRAQIHTGTFQAGRVFLPNDAPWLADYVTEMLGFPNAKHDDQVDSTTQFLGWIKQSDEKSYTPIHVHIVPASFSDDEWGNY